MLSDNSLNSVYVLNGVIAPHIIHDLSDNTKIPSANGESDARALQRFFQNLSTT
jgi:hypothetical protein